MANIRPDDPLLECLAVVSKSLGIPFPRRSLKVGLLEQDNMLDPRSLEKASLRLGLKCTILPLSMTELIRRLSGAVLFISRENNPCVLLDRDLTLQSFLVFNGVDGTYSHLDYKEFKAIFGGYSATFAQMPEREMRSQQLAKDAKSSWFLETCNRVKPYFIYILVSTVCLNLFAFAVPLYIMNVYDKVIPMSSTDTLWSLTIGVSIILIFDFIVGTLRQFLLGSSAFQIDCELDKSLFERTMRIKMVDHQVSPGAFLNYNKLFVAIRNFITSSALSTLIDLPFIVFFFAVIWYIGGKMVLVPLAGVSALMLVNLLCMGYKNRAAEGNNAIASQETAIKIEAISYLENLKLLNAEGFFMKRFLGAGALGKVTNEGLKNAFIANLLRIIPMITSITLMITGAYMIMQSQITVGGLVACSIFNGRAMLVSQFGNIIGQIAIIKRAINELDEFMRKEVEDPDGHKLFHIDLDEARCEISFERVGFRYKDSSRDALHNIDFTIKKGEKVAIIGRTGSGKSTLLRCLTSLYEVTDGLLKIDGIDTRDISPASLRCLINFVPPDSKPIYGTIRENIVFGNPDASPAEVQKVIDTTLLARFLNKHPRGLELIVGEQCTYLSAGEVQQLALARALLSKSPVIMLDEPSANLDNLTAREIIENVMDYVEDRTLIMVVHRPFILDYVDRVIVMQDGKVVRDGPREEIVKIIEGEAG